MACAWALLFVACSPGNAATGFNVAILDFKASNTSEADAATNSDFVRSAFVRTGAYSVVDKGNMERILAEQAFQQTGCTESGCAVKLGNLLSVHKVVVGNYSVMDGVKFLTASIVDVETGRIERTGSVKGFAVGDADEAAGNLVAILTGQAEPKGSLSVQQHSGQRGSDPRIAAGRMGVGLNYPGVGLRLFFADRYAVEAKAQYERPTLVAGPRLYGYIGSLGRLFPYAGLEGVYARFRENEVAANGYAAGAFVGGEIYIRSKCSIQFDFGSTYIFLADRNLSISVDGLRFTTNFGLNYYFGATPVAASEEK